MQLLENKEITDVYMDSEFSFAADDPFRFARAIEVKIIDKLRTEYRVRITFENGYILENLLPGLEGTLVYIPPDKDGRRAKP